MDADAIAARMEEARTVLDEAAEALAAGDLADFEASAGDLRDLRDRLQRLERDVREWYGDHAVVRLRRTHPR